jgi:hypothetical protein
MDSRLIADALSNALQTGTPLPDSIRAKVRDVRRSDESLPGSGPESIVTTLNDGNEFTITVTHTDDGKAWK